jgi:hypothetical protein
MDMFSIFLRNIDNNKLLGVCNIRCNRFAPKPNINKNIINFGLKNIVRIVYPPDIEFKKFKNIIEVTKTNNL